MKINQRSILALFTVGLVAACGGSTTSTPSGSGSGSSGGSGSGSSAGSGSSSGVAGGSGSSGGSSGVGAGSGMTPTGPILAGNATPGMGTIKCGGGPACMAPQVCCNGGRGGATCMTLAACDANNDSFTCTSPANCTAPDVCCFRNGVTAGGNDQTACEASCSGGRGGPEVVCVVDTDCPAGLVCRGGGAGGAPMSVLMTCQQPAGPRPTPDAGTAPPDSGAPAIDAGAAPADASVTDTGTAPADAGIVDAARDAGGG